MDLFINSGSLITHPSIRDDFVPSFSKDLIGISPSLTTGVVGIVNSNLMFIMDSDPVINKLLDFVFQFSKDNNLIIFTGKKIDDLYTTPI